MRHFFAASFLLFAAAALAAGDFTLNHDRPSLRLDYRGAALISGSEFLSGERDCLAAAQDRSETALEDGGRAYNVWNADRAMPFRQEAAVNGDGSEVEITFQTEFDAYHPALDNAAQTFRLRLPMARVQNLKYRSCSGLRRSMKEVAGRVEPGFTGLLGKVPHSFLQLYDDDGFSLVFDFNPAGLGNNIGGYSVNSIRGEWRVRCDGDDLIMETAGMPAFFGGSLSAKVIIFTGTLADYDRRHALRSFAYPDAAPPAERQLVFGAPKYGDAYRPGDLAFDAERHYGWRSKPATTLNVGAPEGAFYSNLAGAGPAVYRFENLRPGLHLVTVGAGNYTGVANRFSLSFNGAAAVRSFSVPAGQLSLVSRAVWIEGGELEITFDGDFLLSTLAVQPLLAAAEDFSVRRGFWRSDAYEPAVLFQNHRYRTPPVFPVAVNAFALPKPGSEMSGRIAPPERPVVLPKNSAALDWRYSGVLGSLGPANSGTFQEFSDPAKLERRLDELETEGINVISLSGMLSRHTYLGHHDRVIAEIRKIVAAGHRRGMKFIDHQDLTLLWNLDAGFRLAAEHLPELSRTVSGQLPTVQYCLSNPDMRARFQRYLLKLIEESDLDGLMLDEVKFYTHGCGCGLCRRKFQADTGCQLPANELDPALENRNHPLWQQWLNWRRREVTDCWIELRRAIDTVKPDFSLLCYTTHYGFNSNYDALGQGQDLVEIARAVDFLGTEIMPRNILTNSRAVMTYRRAKNLLRYAYGSPIYGLVYPAGDWRVAYFGWALNNMNGQVTWQSRGLATPRGEVPNFTAFDAKRGNMNLKTAEPVAEIALLFSRPSRDWNKKINFANELHGLAQTLESMHVPYQFIGEMSLTAEALRPFKVLMLGASGCLSDRDLAVIKQFAADGGTVFLTTVTGLFDELGHERAKWGFADVFGADFPAKTSRLKAILDPATGEPFELPAPVSAWFPRGVKPDQIYLSRPGGKNGLPLIFAKSSGRGRFIYQPAALATLQRAHERRTGTRWGFELNPAFDRIYRGVLREIVGEAAVWQVDAPDQVFTSLYRQGGRTIAHFLNATAAQLKKDDTVVNGAPDPAFPPLARDIRFSLKLPQLRRVWAVSPDFEGERELKFRKLDDGRFEVTLPKELLKAYTIVNLE